MSKENEMDYSKGISEGARPRAHLVGSDGNIFALLARATKCLKFNGHRDAAPYMQRRVFAAKSYDEALAIICEYVEP